MSTEQRAGRPADALAEAARAPNCSSSAPAALGGIGGFMVGSVGLSVVAYADRPVVLVRAGKLAADEHEPDPVGIPSAATPFRPVVLGPRRRSTRTRR